MLLHHIVVNEVKYCVSHSDTQAGHILFMGTDGHINEATPVLQYHLEAILCLICLCLFKPVAQCILVIISVCLCEL